MSKLSGCLKSCGGHSCAKSVLLICLLASGVLFCFLSATTTRARQDSIFPYSVLCDYRLFIAPSISSDRPYFESSCHLRDTCYPPVAYCILKIFSNRKGTRWSFSAGEKCLVASLAVLLCSGIFLLVKWVPSVRDQAIAAIVITISPAVLCTLLRGNPSGWSAALVFVFLYWYDSPRSCKRIVAAIALGFATSLKITPCIFGTLYIYDGMKSGWRFPKTEIFVAALSAILLTFVPFVIFGGVAAVPQWISNAKANADYYSVRDPLWGVVALANYLVPSETFPLPYSKYLVWTTNFIAVILIGASFFSDKSWQRLFCLGASMAFITHHDYGGAYLIPAFVLWLADQECVCVSGICQLLECVAWFFILTPLQIPNPCFAGSLNGVLQNESLFMLLFLVGIGLNLRKYSRVAQVANKEH